PPYRKIHLRQPPCRRVALLSEDRDVPQPPAVLLHEFLRLHEHPARSATRVVHPPLVRRQHRHQHPYHRRPRVELPPLPAPPAPPPPPRPPPGIPAHPPPARPPAAAPSPPRPDS